MIILYLQVVEKLSPGFAVQGLNRYCQDVNFMLMVLLTRLAQEKEIWISTSTGG
jgi:hypothetical protein